MSRWDSVRVGALCAFVWIRTCLLWAYDTAQSLGSRQLECSSCWLPSWLDTLVYNTTHRNVLGRLHSHRGTDCSWQFLMSGGGTVRWPEGHLKGQEPALMCDCILNTRKNWTACTWLHVPPQIQSESTRIWDTCRARGHFLTWNQRSCHLKEHLQEIRPAETELVVEGTKTVKSTTHLGQHRLWPWWQAGWELRQEQDWKRSCSCSGCEAPLLKL